MASHEGRETTIIVSSAYQGSPTRPRVITQEHSFGPVGHNRRASLEGLRPRVDSVVPHSQAQGGFEVPPTKLDDIGARDLETGAGEEEADSIDKHNTTLIAIDELELPHATRRLPNHFRKDHGHLGATAIKTIFAGPSGNQKRLEVPLLLLETKSRYFRALFEKDPNIDQMIFADADPIAMAMWLRWIVVGALEGPHDFHSLTHWFALYVLSIRFEMEALKNYSMDTIRHHYRDEHHTASPFRIEYVYNFTKEGDYMRTFVTTTAATRCIKNGKLTPGIRQLLEKGGQFAVDFAHTLLEFKRDPRIDVRLSPDCPWHTHKYSDACGATRRAQLDGS